MHEFYQFAGDHPFVVLVLAFIAEQIIIWPFRIVNRWIRSRNIKNAGWPPDYCDADGDAVELE